MLVELTQLEEEIMDMLIQGQNPNGITSWLGISYIEYSKNRKFILKKLNIRRITAHAFFLGRLYFSII